MSMDTILLHHPRRAKTSHAEGSPHQVRAQFAPQQLRLLRDMAKNYVRSCRKRGFGNLVDRLQRDLFFWFNAANQDLVLEA